MGPHENHQAVIEKINSGTEVNAAELHELRKSVAHLSLEHRKNLAQSIDAYSQKQRALLEREIDVDTAFKALKQQLEGKPERTPEQIARDIGATASEWADRTTDSAVALGYQEWAALNDPKSPTSTRIVHGFGIAALGYGAYRVAKWVLAHEGDGFFTKILKFVGVTAAASWAINHFGDKAKQELAQPIRPGERPATPQGRTEQPTPRPMDSDLQKRTEALRKAAGEGMLHYEDPRLSQGIDLLALNVPLQVNGHSLQFVKAKEGTKEEVRLKMNKRVYRIKASLKQNVLGAQVEVPANVSRALTGAEKRGKEMILNGSLLGIGGTAYVDDVQIKALVEKMIEKKGDKAIKIELNFTSDPPEKPNRAHKTVTLTLEEIEQAQRQAS